MRCLILFLLSTLLYNYVSCERLPSAEIIDEDFDWSGPTLMQTQNSQTNSTDDHRRTRRILKKQRRQEKRERRLSRRYNKRVLSTFKSADVSTATPHFPPHSRPGPINDQTWLANNLTSIWHILTQLQRDVEMLRRRSPGHASKATPTRRKEKKVKLATPTEAPECPSPQLEGMTLQRCLSHNGTECSTNGRCVCGSCVCHSPYYGSQCQCDDTACRKVNEIMCGGTKQGQCRCGSCVCRPNFTGANCECSTETSACTTNRQDVCSSNGHCKCNRCYCNEGYVGPLCEESIYSASICEKLKQCVLCQAYGWFYPQCQDCQIKIVRVNQIEMSRKTCVMVNLGCILKYSYEEDQASNEALAVYVPKGLTCPSPKNNEKKKLLHQPPK